MVGGQLYQRRSHLCKCCTEVKIRPWHGEGSPRSLSYSEVGCSTPQIPHIASDGINSLAQDGNVNKMSYKYLNWYTLMQEKKGIGKRKRHKSYLVNRWVTSVFFSQRLIMTAPTVWGGKKVMTYVNLTSTVKLLAHHPSSKCPPPPPPPLSSHHPLAHSIFPTLAVKHRRVWP